MFDGKVSQKKPMFLMWLVQFNYFEPAWAQSAEELSSAPQQFCDSIIQKCIDFHFLCCSELWDNCAFSIQWWKEWLYFCEFALSDPTSKKLEHLGMFQLCKNKNHTGSIKLISARFPDGNLKLQRLLWHQFAIPSFVRLFPQYFLSFLLFMN